MFIPTHVRNLAQEWGIPNRLKDALPYELASTLDYRSPVSHLSAKPSNEWGALPREWGKLPR